MNYLELCQRTHRECGLSGNGPAAVTGQQGQSLKIVEWVAEAWTEIQNARPDWKFMRAEASFSIGSTPGTRDYAPGDVSITDMEEWDTDSFYIYETAVGVSSQEKLPYYDYLDWRDAYRERMTAIPNGKPRLFTILNDSETLRFEPAEDTIYTIESEYKRMAQVFTANADEPTGFPSRFHMIIVYKAMEKYGYFDSASEIIAKAENELAIWWPQLERSQLPRLRIGSQPIA